MTHTCIHWNYIYMYCVYVYIHIFIYLKLCIKKSFPIKDVYKNKRKKEEQEWDFQRIRSKYNIVICIIKAIT